MEVGTPVALRRFLLLGAFLTPFNYVVAIPAGPITLHPLQVWAVLLVMLTLVRKPRTVLEAGDPPALLLWTMFAFVGVSTVLGTPDQFRVRGYLDAFLLAINLAAFTLSYGHLRSDPAGWAPFARTLFGASLLSSGFLVVRALLVARSGMFVLPDSYMLGLGTVTGTFTAALAAASVSGMTFAATRRLRVWMMVGIVLHGMAASLSLARGPWIAFAIGVAVTFVLMVRWLPTLSAVAGAIFRGAVALALLLSATVAVSLANATVGLLVASRAVQVTNLGSGTGRARLSLFRALLEDAMDSPVFGHGAAAYRQVSELLQVQGAISENFLLEMFHAGGAVAAVPLVLAAGIVTIRMTRSLGAPPHGAVPAACLAGVLALMLGSLTNPAAWDTGFWVLVATAAALRPVVLPPNLSTTQALEVTTR